MSQILLVSCQTKGLVTKVEHLGLGYLAAVLGQHGIPAGVFDASFHGLSRDVLRARVIEERPRLVGFTAFYNNIAETLATAAALRRDGFDGHICLGGHHATFNASQILADWPQIDSVVRGEGENALTELAEHLLGGADWRSTPNISFRRDGIISTNPCAPLIDNLDLLPFPRRDDYAVFLRHNKMASVVSSRGCYGRCSFCSIRAFYSLSDGRRWRPRNPDNVVDEIEQLVEAFGIQRINFLDDEFIGTGRKGRERAWAIGDAIRSRGIKISFNIVCRPDSLDEELLRFLMTAGLGHVSVGLESWLPRQLALYGKGTTVADNRRAVQLLEELGLDYMFFLIPADPYVTPEELLENLERIEEAGIGHAADGFTFSQLMVFPGTALEHSFAKEGIIRVPPNGKAYLGPLPCVFRDRRTERIYERWQPILKEYASLRAGIARLGVEGQGEGIGETLSRHCQEVLNASAHTLFKSFVRTELAGLDSDYTSLAQDELDRLVFTEVIAALARASDVPPANQGLLPHGLLDPISGMCNEMLSGYEAVRRRLAALTNTQGEAPIPDLVFAGELRRALRRSALALLARIMLACRRGQAQPARTMVARVLTTLDADISRLESLARNGTFRRFAPLHLRFAQRTMRYPSQPIRRLSRQLLRRLVR